MDEEWWGGGSKGITVIYLLLEYEYFVVIGKTVFAKQDSLSLTNFFSSSLFTVPFFSQLGEGG